MEPGAVVPGATVTILNPGNNSEVTVKSNDEGLYEAPFLMPATYKVTVGATGFATAVVNDVIVSVGQRRGLMSSSRRGCLCKGGCDRHSGIAADRIRQHWSSYYRQAINSVADQHLRNPDSVATPTITGGIKICFFPIFFLGLSSLIFLLGTHCHL